MGARFKRLDQSGGRVSRRVYWPPGPVVGRPDQPIAWTERTSSWCAERRSLVRPRNRGAERRQRRGGEETWTCTTEIGRVRQTDCLASTTWNPRRIGGAPAVLRALSLARWPAARPPRVWLRA